MVWQASTHVNVHEDIKDVKLWQVHTLLKGLEKIASSADIPMLVCGDFNSVPGSASHSLLAMGKVDQMHPDLAVDPFAILRPITKANSSASLGECLFIFCRNEGCQYSILVPNIRGGWTPPQMNHCLHIVLGTLLVPLITYFIRLIP